MPIPSVEATDTTNQPRRSSCSPAVAGEVPLSVRVYSALEELPQTYSPLFEEEGRRSFFMTLRWFRNFVNAALDPGDRLRIYGAAEALDGSAPAGIFLGRSSHSASGAFSLRKLSSLTNYYSPYFGPHLVQSKARQRDALRAMTQAIAAERPRWDAVEIKLLPADSETFPMLVEEFKAAGFVTQTFFGYGNWYEPINGRPYREYFDSLRSSVRNIAKSKNKKIDRSGRVRCEILSSTEGLDAAIGAYNQIYGASWKVPEPYPEFVPGLIRVCAEQGSLRLGLAFVDGEPAAAQVWIVHAGVASIYKIAYDQKFRDLSVGTYLTTRLMEHVLDVDHVHEVDYLTGDDNYKKDWMSKRRERWGILALNPRTPRGVVAIARHVGGRALKRAALSVTHRLRREKKQGNA